MFRLLISVVLLAASVAFAAPAESPPTAQADTRPFHWIAGLTYDVGFYELASVTLTNGSTESLRANSGFGLIAGATVRNVPSGLLETQLTLGAKFSPIGGSNGELVWFSFPLEAVELVDVAQLLPAAPWENALLRAGAGMTLQLFPMVSGSGVVSSLSFSFPPSPGLLIELQGGVRNPATGKVWFVGLRYALVRFAGPLPPFFASSVGISGATTF